MAADVVWGAASGLRIGFDAKRYIANATGLGVYARLLIDTWTEVFASDELVLYTPRGVTTAAADSSRGRRVVAPDWPLGRALWRSVAPLRLAAQDGLDIYHGLSNEIPWRSASSRQKRTKVVVTIHDVLFREFPEQYPAADRLVYDLKTRYACRHADRIVAISEATAARLREDYGVPEDRLAVIHQAVHPIFAATVPDDAVSEVRRHYSLQRDYLLCLGSVVHRKNQLRLLEAYRLLPASEAPDLVIAGALGSPYAAEVQRYAQRYLANRPVHFLGSVPHHALPALLRGAVMSVYVSLGEGFGLPVTESLLAGTPVVTSTLSSMPEAGVGLAVLVDPRQPESIAEGLREALAGRSALVERLHNERHRLAPFEPPSHVRRMRDLYLRCLG